MEGGCVEKSRQRGAAGYERSCGVWTSEVDAGVVDVHVNEGHFVKGPEEGLRGKTLNMDNNFFFMI